MKKVKIDFILKSGVRLGFLLLFIALFGYINKYHDEQVTKLNRLDSLYTSIAEHNHFVDSMHYSKCAFVLKDGILADTDN